VRPPKEAAAAFGAAWCELERELDWERLGASYCDGPAPDFFSRERRERLLEVGLELGSAVARALPERGPRRSLYVGAAVAEIAPILMEHLALERMVAWVNLPGDELDELARAVAAVNGRLGLDLPGPRSVQLGVLPFERCDHVWLVSVLTDPDVYPALHDALYERRGTALATGRGELAAERADAERLVGHLLDRVAQGCVLTTTDEELELIAPLAAARALELEIPERSQLSALAGDAVRVCRLRSRSEAER
jgi:hypothetical protein